jgi:hypothetical protein
MSLPIFSKQSPKDTILNRYNSCQYYHYQHENISLIGHFAEAIGSVIA